MDDYRVSDTLKAKLGRDGMRGTTAGTVGLHGMKTRGTAGKGVHSQSRQREVSLPMGIRLVVSNKDWRARPKASNARLGARQPLVLVWSDGHLVSQPAR